MAWLKNLNLVIFYDSPKKHFTTFTRMSIAAPYLHSAYPHTRPGVALHNIYIDRLKVIFQNTNKGWNAICVSRFEIWSWIQLSSVLDGFVWDIHNTISMKTPTTTTLLQTNSFTTMGVHDPLSVHTWGLFTDFIMNVWNIKISNTKLSKFQSNN